MEKIDIITPRGEKVLAMAPVVVSASRSTDIPAFYAKWFMKRLEAGYVVWYNPFNQKPSYVSFKNAKVIVFWTKNPAPLLPYLDDLDARDLHYYFQFTLNDYEKESFEPKLPLLSRRIETFKTLSERIGKDRVIWRFDPIILCDDITPRDILMRIWNIGNQIKGYTSKLVFSFVDIKDYRKVQNNLVKESDRFNRETVMTSEPTHDQIEEICIGLEKIRQRWKEQGWDIELATCCESVNLDRFGIKHNRCIDDELMKRLFSDDIDLMHFLSTGKLPEVHSESLFDSEDVIPIKSINLKDRGQRKECGCIVSKDIGMYNTCGHLCIYCYANTSRKVVIDNMKKHSTNSESIIG